MSKHEGIKTYLGSLDSLAVTAEATNWLDIESSRHGHSRACLVESLSKNSMTGFGSYNHVF